MTAASPPAPVLSGPLDRSTPARAFLTDAVAIGRATACWDYPTLREFQRRQCGRLLMLIGFFLPFSTTLIEICLGVFLYHWLCTWDWRNTARCIRESLPLQLVVAIVALFVVGIFYSPADWSDIYPDLKKQRKLLLIPLFALTLRDPTTRQQTLRAFQVGMTVTLIASFLYCIHLHEVRHHLPVMQSYAPFKNRITHSVLMASFCIITCRDLVRFRRNRWRPAMMLALAVPNILFMSSARTGYLLVGLAIVWILWEVWSFRGLIVGAVLTTILAATCFQFAKPFRQRTANTYRQVRVAIGEVDGSTKPNERRFQFYKRSFSLGSQQPVFGLGTGGFAHGYRELSRRDGIEFIDNPHSQYLFVYVEQGLLGLILLVGLFGCLWFQARKLTLPDRLLARGIVLIAATGCLFNAILLDVTEGYLFAFVTAMACGTVLNRNAAEESPTEPRLPARASIDHAASRAA